MVKEELASAGQRFMYFLAQYVTLDDGGAEQEVAVLERMEYDPGGDWASMVAFVAKGDEALPLVKFYSRFLQAKGPRQMRIGVMLARGITANEDLRAGAGVRDINKMFVALAAATESCVGLHFFVDPND